MELKKAIQARHSVRKFKDVPVPDEDIKAVVDAARLAPSGKNLQNWHYIAVKDQKVKEELYQVILEKNNYIADKLTGIDEERAEKFRKAFKYNTSFFINAPVVFFIYSTDYVSGGVEELFMIDEPEENFKNLLELSSGMQSLGASINNLMLAATEKGYGTCWLTSCNYAGPEIEKYMKSNFDFDKEGYYFSAMVVMGVPEGEGKSPKKKAVEEVLTII